MDGAMENLYRKIAAIGRRFQAERVVLFGSRARGDNRSRSDIDIAVFGASPDDLPAFREQLDELPTLLEFDLVFVTEQTDPKLVSNIERDGVILMDKMQEKYEKLSKPFNDWMRPSLITIRWAWIPSAMVSSRDLSSVRSWPGRHCESICWTRGIQRSTARSL